MLKDKKITAIFLVFLMLLGAIVPASETFAQDTHELKKARINRMELKDQNDDVIKINNNNKRATVLSDIRLTPIDKDKTEYLTHEKVTFDVGFSTSNTSGKLDNTKFVITFPAEYIKVDTLDNYTDDDGIQLSKLDTAESGPDLQLIDGNWVITYTYDSVPGGYSGDVPISIRTVMGDTPNGYKLPITVKVTDRDGNTLTNGEITKELTFKTKPPKHRKRIGVGDEILNNSEGRVEKLRVGPAKDDKGNQLTGDLGQITAPQGHKPVNFRFDLYEDVRRNKDVGVRKYEKVVIEDKMPEGAVFIPSENPGWTETTEENGEKILRYEANYPDGVDFNYKLGIYEQYDNSPIRDSQGKPVYLKLYFPGVTVKENNKDKIFTNTSTVELTPHQMKLDDKVTKVSGQVNFNLEAYVAAAEVEKKSWDVRVSDVVDQRQKSQRWMITVRNFSDVDFTSLEINDFLGNYKDIDSKASKESINEMDLVELKIFAKSKNVFKGSFDIYAVTRDGSKKELGKNIGLDKDYSVNLPKDTVSVSLVATPGSIFYGQGFNAEDEAKNKIVINVYSKFKNKNPKGISSAESKWNSVKSTVKVSGKDYIQQDNDDLILNPVNREYKIRKEVIDLQPAYHVDTEVPFKIKAWLGNLYAGDKNDVVRIVDILPEFTEYVKGSTTNTRDNRKILNGKELEPKIVENYMGLGKTALIWEFGPLENNTDKLIKGFMNDSYFNLELDYKIKIKRGAIGELENATYLGFEGGTIRTPESKTISDDIVDANGNGDNTDKVSKSSAKFRVAPPRELIGVKYVIGSEDSNYISSSGNATAEVDGSGVYKLRLHNTNSIDYDQAILVDVLPYVGDYTLSSAATSGYEKEYRKSNFEVKLSGPVKFLDPFKADDTDLNDTANRFDVFYSFERPNSEDKIGEYSFGTRAWKTEAEVGQNWNQVKAIKIQLKEGKVIKGDTFDDFYVEFNMPGNQNLTEANQIRNSFAFSTYPSVDSLNESNIVTLKPVKYKVKGISWIDKDNKGTYNDGEKLLKDTKVRLMKVNEDGSFEVAKDTKGKEYVTTTDKNGHYEFDVYNKGKYFVEMIHPDNHVATKVVEDSDKGNHMTDQNDEESAKYSYSSSKEFDLNKDHKEQIANGGWYRSSIDIKVTKNWELIGDKNPVDKIEVELYRDGVATGKKLTLNDENKWSVEFKNQDITEKPGSTDYKYTVKEVGEEKGSIKLSDRWFNVTYEGSMKEGFTITNKESKPWTPMEVPTRNVKVTKTWKLIGNKNPSDNIEVELYKDGIPTGKKETLNAGNNWSTSFNKLPVYESLENTKAFEYTVKEVGGEKGSIKLSDRWFKVTYEGSMKDGFKITNKELEKKNPNKKDKINPNTGDSFNGYLYIGLILISAGLLLSLEFNKKKKNSNIE